MKRTADIKLHELFSHVPSRFHLRSDLHLMRKMFHMTLGLVMVYCYLAITTRMTAVMILGSILGFDLLFERKRLRNRALNQKMLKFWGPFMRAHEVDRVSTVPHYVSAAMIAIGIFPKPVAILCLLYLACGDPVASLMGILYGHKGHRFTSGKTLIGTLAGVSICALLTFFYLKSLGTFTNETILMMSVIGGLAGGVTELLPFEIDDNFTIPVISGFVVWLAFMVFGLS